MRSTSAICGLWILLIICAGACGGATSTSNSETPTNINHLKAKGFVYSPKTFDDHEVDNFYTEISTIKNGSCVWNTPWRDDYVGGSDAGTIPNLPAYAANKASANNVKNIGVFNWRIDQNVYIKTQNNNDNTWKNNDARAKYKDMVVAYCEIYKPPYLCLGNENEFYYLDHQDDYPNWVSLYNEVYDAIKALAPFTRVGPCFNFENLSGFESPGVFHNSLWPALETHDFSKIDFIGLTMYPMLYKGDPRNIPSNYLTPLFDRIGNLPIGITETGWPAETYGPLTLPWQATEEAQINYLDTLKRVLEGRSIIFLHWLVLHPIPEILSTPINHQIFGSISVRNSSGAKRMSYDPWWIFPEVSAL